MNKLGQVLALEGSYIMDQIGFLFKLHIGKMINIIRSEICMMPLI